ncbi:hypothetical protein WICANDRAFT_26064 [Wickerhamomyces anomalus NRRL Y-366-8]|uniref:Sodium/calcium exchanger membrane region domain-containing protein n=1 Tax=Wickerhamomyces anomalus (strain ATCC 58044 / CBS 1984 / NCYC 433 / NRRL Y-366-8) TaxID=683960 RepID=A0A1E3PCU2_WICAA|nr:uncharacterized protein WICANDRAFT_26064 [Wickerhamomyces anomalus NRRL Y-366-8]ODQ62782.1 hypothetical protein WICANDRAFT_26064 [Wickerhamomyces anomalus NRRL Y-366-8]
MARYKVRSTIQRHHWLILFIYLFPLGFFFYCLNVAAIDYQGESINIAAKHNDTLTDHHTCDVSGFQKGDSSAICSYITQNCDIDLFKISRVYYCDQDSRIRIGLGLGVFIGLVIIFIIFGLITSNFLYPNLDLLSKHLKISNRISGLTLLSLGNATPDIFSTYIAFKSNSSSLAIGELLGSANFVICFVIGSMGILKPFQVNHFEFSKDLYFFMALILISLYFVHDEKLMNFECILMVLLYLIYVNYSIFFTNEGKEPEELMPMPPRQDEENYLTPNLVPQEGYEHSIRSSLDENKSKGLQKLKEKDSIWMHLFATFNDETDTNSFLSIATLPLLFSLNLLIPVFSKDLEIGEFQSLIEFKKKLFNIQLFIIPIFFKYLLFTNLPIYLTLLISISLLLINIILHHHHRYTIPFVGFVSSILIIVTTSSHLITILKNIGVIFRISESLLGLTILALGNSTGDLISNLTLAELNLSVIGINACFGSPLLYILIGIGINGLIVNFENSSQFLKLKIDLNFKMSSFGLILMLIFYAVAIPLNGWFIDRKIGIIGVTWWCIITGINVYLETNYGLK